MTQFAVIKKLTAPDRAEVEVLRGGRVIGEGTLMAVDVWGRATVRLANGSQELEIAPEQARLRYV